MRALATAATRTATACSWLRARRRRRARRRDGATRLPRRQARHRFLQPGRLLDAHRAGRLVHRHRHHGQPPESQSQVHGGDTSSTKGRAFTASVEAGLPIALKPNLSLGRRRRSSTRIPASIRSGIPRPTCPSRRRTHSSAALARGCRASTRPRAPPGSPMCGRTWSTRWADATRSTSAAAPPARRPWAAPRRAWDWASRSSQRAGQRLRVGGIWLQPGRRAARNGAGQPGSADQLVNAAPGLPAPDVLWSGHDGLRHSRPWRPFALAWAQRRRAGHQRRRGL